MERGLSYTSGHPNNGRGLTQRRKGTRLWKCLYTGYWTLLRIIIIQVHPVKLKWFAEPNVMPKLQFSVQMQEYCPVQVRLYSVDSPKKSIVDSFPTSTSDRRTHRFAHRLWTI